MVLDLDAPHITSGVKTKLFNLEAKARTTKFGTRRLTIGLYASSVFLYWIGLYLYVPTLPVYIQDKVNNLSTVGLVLSMYGLWMAVIRLPLGIAADWIGWRKPFILSGFVLTGVGAWLLGTADESFGLITGRAITGLAAGTWVPLVVGFNSLFPKDETIRATALLVMIGSLGRMLATGATGFLNGLGGYSLAFSLAALASLLSVVIILPVGEKRTAPRRPSSEALFKLSTRRDVLLPALLSAAGQYVNWTVTFGFLPILAASLGASDVAQSMLMSLSIAMFVLGNFLTSVVNKRIGSQRLIIAVFSLMAASTAAAAFATELWMIFASQIVLGIAHGVGNPLLMGLSIRYVADDERSTAMGLHQAVYAVGMFVGPSVSGFLADWMGIQPMFGVTAIVGLGLGLLGARLLVDDNRCRWPIVR